MNVSKQNETHWHSNINLKTIELSPIGSTHPDSPVLIWLHGYGENETIHPEEISKLNSMRILSIRAPIKIHNDAYAWCHVEFTPNGPVDDPCEAEESRTALLSFMEEFRKTEGESRKIILAGFSQGATIALSAALSDPDGIDGAASFCGRIIPEYLPGITNKETLGKMPILLINGIEDTILPLRHARASRYALQELTETLDWREVPIRHEITEECSNIFLQWIRKRFPQTDNSA